MKEPIGVAQIIGNANAGGVESVIMNFYKNIDRSKVQFDFFVQQCCPIINRETVEKMGGKIVIIPPVKKLRKYKKELVRIFKEGNYKIVHSNMNTLSVFTLKAAKKAGVKVRIAESHSTASPKEFVKSFAKYMLRPFSKKYANYYFGCSKKAGIWQFGKKTFQKGQISIFYNSIDIDKFAFNVNSRNEIRKQYNIPNDALVLGHVGRFVNVKNHAFLLEVFAQVKNKHENSKLLLVGDGPLKADIETKAKELGIEKDVIFAGVFSNTAPFYSAMDAFVMPSLYEGLPVVGIEAQASGLVCLLSDAITDETKAIDKLTFVSLKESAQEWADRILKEKYDYDRTVYSKQLLDGHFNIKNNAKLLVEKYEEYLKEQYNE